MLYESFGLEQMGSKEPTDLDQTIVDTKHLLSSVMAQLVLLESYEITYDIFDHGYGLYHPWNLVLSREKETYRPYSQLHHFYQRFLLHRVNNRFGLSVTDLLAMERESVDRIFDLCAQESYKRSQELESIKQQQDLFEQERFDVEDHDQEL